MSSAPWISVLIIKYYMVFNSVLNVVTCSSICLIFFSLKKPTPHLSAAQSDNVSYQNTSLKVGLSLTLVPGLITPAETWGLLCELHGVFMAVTLFSRITCSQTIFLRGHQATAPSFRPRTVDLTLLFLIPPVYNRAAEEERTVANLVKIKSAFS